MTREQKFWNAVYRVIGETCHLLDIGVLTDADYHDVIKALNLSIAKLREQQKEEEKR